MFVLYSISVFGAVIGIQTGRSVELLNSFELVTDEVDGNVVINEEYYEMKSEQCKLLTSKFLVLSNNGQVNRTVCCVSSI